MAVFSENKKEIEEMIYKYLKEEIEKKDGLWSKGKYKYPVFKKESLYFDLIKKVDNDNAQLGEIFNKQRKVMSNVL